MRQIALSFIMSLSLVLAAACGSIDVPTEASAACQPGCISGTPKACVDGKEELLPLCQEGFECAPSTGQCIPIQTEPAEDLDRDDDGVLDAEDCAPDDPAYQTRTCAEGAECGDDGCGGVCGACAESETCEAGACVSPCEPACGDSACGDDGCGGSCGACDEGESCNAEGACESACTPACDESECGDDGCGGSCGACDEGESCKRGGRLREHVHPSVRRE